MDRTRVICPSISFAAHLTGATILGMALLFLPERLPPTCSPAPVGPWSGARVDLGRSPGGGSARRLSRPRVSPPARPVIPAIVPPIEIGSTLDLDAGSGIEGIPDELGQEGEGRGLCLSNCGGTPPEREIGKVIPPLEEHARQPVRMTGGDLRAPVKVLHVAPAYPPLAAAAHVEGRVTLDCVIDERGHVTSVAIVHGHPLLEAAAVEAVSQWRYKPTLLNGETVSVLLEVTVDFRLS
jgi:TonB family protein